MKKVELDWQKIGRQLAITENIALVAQTVFLTQLELEKAFVNWKQRPANCPDLENFMKQQKAVLAVENMEVLQTAAITRQNSRANALYLALKNKADKTDVEALKPACCPAAAFFEKGFSMADTELVLGELKCAIKETCRKKCLQIAKFRIRDKQDEKINEGNPALLQYFGTNILHQDTGGNEGFNPAKWNFVINGDQNGNNKS